MNAKMKTEWTVVYYWRGERHRQFYPSRAAAIANCEVIRKNGFPGAYVSEW